MNGDIARSPRWLGLVQQQVEAIEFGLVQIVIHGSRVVRIERTEKLLVPEDVQPSNDESKP